MNFIEEIRISSRKVVEMASKFENCCQDLMLKIGISLGAFRHNGPGEPFIEKSRKNCEMKTPLGGLFRPRITYNV